MNTAMIVDALPVSFVMALMGIASIKTLVLDGMRNSAETTKSAAPADKPAEPAK